MNEALSAQATDEGHFVFFTAGKTWTNGGGGMVVWRGGELGVGIDVRKVCDDPRDGGQKVD